MFVSGVFVPPTELPIPLRQIAQYNPLTTTATGIRRLFHNPTLDWVTPGFSTTPYSGASHGALPSSLFSHRSPVAAFFT
jgi:ABC-type polysaccharide/polyol phosphate export permease